MRTFYFSLFEDSEPLVALLDRSTSLKLLETFVYTTGELPKLRSPSVTKCPSAARPLRKKT